MIPTDFIIIKEIQKSDKPRSLFMVRGIGPKSFTLYEWLRQRKLTGEFLNWPWHGFSFVDIEDEKEFRNMYKSYIGLGD